ncbi:MAG TPA: glycosyltransferase family 2 protein [Phycisphaerae bacterium]|nr:glycosyltransferase family 2 protein [Phycisphaerae bacterium]
MSAQAWATSGSGPASVREGRLAVIIVHYKTPEMLRECLDSLAPELDPGRDQVLVVDNASGPEHVEALRAATERPGVRLIASETNLGFAGANNLALRTVLEESERERSVPPELFMLLNPDTLVRPGAVGVLREFLAGHEEADLVGPRLEFPDGAAQLSAFGDPTPISELVRGANIGPITRLLRRWEVYGEVKNRAHRADWLSGACVMMRRRVIEEVGLLDDEFFMYYEEVDFFRRARRRGFQAWYVPEAHVVHLVGQASGVEWKKAARRLPGYWFESRQHYFRKHFGWLGMVAADGAWMTGYCLMRVRRLVTGYSPSIVAQGEFRDLARQSWRGMWKRRGAPRGGAGRDGGAVRALVVGEGIR